MSKRPTCSTCIYFSQAMDRYGECRIGPDFVSRQVTDWCGEHPDFPHPVAPEPVPTPLPEPAPDAPVEPQTASPAQRRRKPAEDN